MALVGSNPPKSTTVDFRLLIRAIAIGVDMAFVESHPIVLLDT